MTILLTSDLLIPKNMNPSGMDMVISRGAKITKRESGHITICILRNGESSCAPQSSLEFSKIIWEQAVNQESKKKY